MRRSYRIGKTNCWFLSFYASIALSDYAGPVYGTKHASAVRTKAAKRRVVKVSLLSEIQGMLLVYWHFSDPVGANSQCWRHLTQQYLPSVHSIFSISVHGHNLINFRKRFLTIAEVNLSS